MLLSKFKLYEMNHWLVNIVVPVFIRNHRIYYMFGFLLLVYIILVIICSETTILLCYFHLCNEVSYLQQTIHGLFCWIWQIWSCITIFRFNVLNPICKELDTMSKLFRFVEGNVDQFIFLKLYRTTASNHTSK